MVNQLLVTLVISVLGAGKPTARGNQSYYCPSCNHHKQKLEVNFNESSSHYQHYACWVCDLKGKSIYSLFKTIKASAEKLAEASKYSKSKIKVNVNEVKQSINLPPEFTSLNNVSKSNVMGKHALMYLKNRNINKYDILRYNIGYCSKGKYQNMLIIPTYDADGKLNYFTARSFMKDSFIKYKNPEYSRNIIPNEYMINWNLPIIICEGLFDAIAIKRNAIPLLGKNIQDNLMKKIVTSKVNKIYIALDKDAIKQALQFCEMLLAEGKEVYLIDIQDKDPSDLGFEKFIKLLQQTKVLTYNSLLEKKLSL